MTPAEIGAVTDGFEHVAGLEVDTALRAFLEDEALCGLSVTPAHFWDSFAAIIDEFTPRHHKMIAVRADMQKIIDEWHRGNVEKPYDAYAYRCLLESIGYIVPRGPEFHIETTNVDPEIAHIAGPQLVVPATNARFVVNAANARWGSLYDALYGTDALGEPPRSGPYDSERGSRVVAWVRSFLDDVVPLEKGSHGDVVTYRLEGSPRRLVALFGDNFGSGLSDPRQFIGSCGSESSPTSLLLQNHGLAIEIQINRDSPIGASDRAGVVDVHLESALTTIVDLEDSVATVDGVDKVLAYRNWLGLMRGELVGTVTKDGSTFQRHLACDRHFDASDGARLTRRGRALMLVRNVGHLLFTPAVRDRHGREVPEGIVDAMVSVLCALHDLARPPSDRNSPAGSVYVVKPKMHGPDEISLTSDLFGAVERALGLPPNTVKMGIMDEERRTTVNLPECIRAAKSRVAFINTGFLDRTGDEIHTSMLAGPMVRKADMRLQPWFAAYETWNVDVGVACGFVGRAQIGKGMWAAPDRMADLLEQKIDHPRAGASCAWVPSPTAATLHATHYHRVDVFAEQVKLSGHVRARLEDILSIPLTPVRSWSPGERRAEIDNNVQGILGYVVRWVDQGIGCSKVPDLDGVALMEDRATCRISSQHVANWLLHGVVSAEDVHDSFRRMAQIVDRQNANDPAYTPMAPVFDGQAFNAATDLVFHGVFQPSGYTEMILNAYRTEYKRRFP
jgi:malate synthase